MPPEEEEAYKFVREAVHAFPELYFSRLVVLGEGVFRTEDLNGGMKLLPEQRHGLFGRVLFLVEMHPVPERGASVSLAAKDAEHTRGRTRPVIPPLFHPDLSSDRSDDHHCCCQRQEHPGRWFRRAG